MLPADDLAFVIFLPCLLANFAHLGTILQQTTLSASWKNFTGEKGTITMGFFTSAAGLGKAGQLGHLPLAHSNLVIPVFSKPSGESQEMH